MIALLVLAAALGAVAAFSGFTSRAAVVQASRADVLRNRQLTNEVRELTVRINELLDYEAEQNVGHRNRNEELHASICRLARAAVVRLGLPAETCPHQETIPAVAPGSTTTTATPMARSTTSLRRRSPPNLRPPAASSTTCPKKHCDRKEQRERYR